MTQADPDAPRPRPAPRANPDLIGHEAAERRLLDAWRADRIPHAWLITGPPGIGKATLAYRFARFVLAGGGGPADLLDEGRGRGASLHVDPADPVFHRVASGGHADLLTLERELDTTGKRLRTAITVENVRAATAFLGLTAAEGGWRVVIVDNADDLNVNSANALLKTLEEPPNKTLILLISHAPASLPATIRSRCCRLALAPLGDDQVRGLLLRYHPATGADDARILARLAGGGIGRALRLAESGGVALHESIAALLASVPGLDAESLHALAERLARREAEPAYRTATELLQWWVWRTVTARAGHGAGPAASPGPEAPEYERACMERLCALGSLDQWVEVWEKIDRLFGQADGIHLDRKQVVLNAFHCIARVAAA